MTERINRDAGQGEATAGRHRFIDLDGNNTSGHQVIFPILKQVLGGTFQLIGTGFFVSSCGLFASAKHVLLDCFDESGDQKYPICIVQFLPDNQFQFRHILWCSSHNTADVAIGLVEPTRDNEPNAALTLSTSSSSIGGTVATYAYPKTEISQDDYAQVLNFKAAFYDGQLVEYLSNGRDRVLLPGPCYRTSMVIHGGASGGPVMGASGRVLGINSTGYDGQCDISFVSRIDEVLHLKIPSIKFPSGQEVSSVTILDLVRAGWVDLEQQLTGE